MPLCRGRRFAAPFALVLTLLISNAAFAQARINGAVKQKDGTPVGGAVVVLNERGSADVTNAEGKYGFDRVAAGKYTLTITLGDHTAAESITVTNAAAEVITTVDWPL